MHMLWGTPVYKQRLGAEPVPAYQVSLFRTARLRAAYAFENWHEDDSAASTGVRARVRNRCSSPSPALRTAGTERKVMAAERGPAKRRPVAARARNRILAPRILLGATAVTLAATVVLAAGGCGTPRAATTAPPRAAVTSPMPADESPLPTASPSLAEKPLGAVSVTAFGAAGDGAADDAAAVIAAVQAAAAKNVAVWFPPGTYAVGDLAMPQGAVLAGPGAGRAWLNGRISFGGDDHVSDLRVGRDGAATRFTDGAAGTTFHRVTFVGGGGMDSGDDQGVIRFSAGRIRLRHPLRGLHHRRQLGRRQRRQHGQQRSGGRHLPRHLVGALPLPGFAAHEPRGHPATRTQPGPVPTRATATSTCWTASSSPRAPRTCRSTQSAYGRRLHDLRVHLQRSRMEQRLSVRPRASSSTGPPAMRVHRQHRCTAAGER